MTTTEAVRETAYAVTLFIAEVPRTWSEIESTFVYADSRPVSPPMLHRALRALRRAGVIEHDRATRKQLWRSTGKPIPPDLWPHRVLLEHAKRSDPECTEAAWLRLVELRTSTAEGSMLRWTIDACILDLERAMGRRSAEGRVVQEAASP